MDSIPKSEFILSGLAGTGKTTTMVRLIANLMNMGHRPAICAPTGKAASVVNQKLLNAGIADVQAMTLHKALAERPSDALAKMHKRLDELEAAREERGGLTKEEEEEETKMLRDLDRRARQGDTLHFTGKLPEEIESDFSILMFDEASMIGRDKVYTNLITPVNLPRIFVGDEAQLPPVNEEPAVDFSKADVHLKEILRQGADSGILKYAHALHSGRVPTIREMAEYDDVQMIRDGSIGSIKGHEDAQFIVWQNKERHAIAPRLRKALGFDFESQRYPWLPMKGEKLYIDDNNDTVRLSRGDIVTVEGVQLYLYTGNRDKADARNNNPYIATLTVTDRYGRTRDITVSMVDLMPDQVHPSYQRDQGIRRYASYTAGTNRVKVLWANVITCHRAQGSEYDKVFMLGTMMPESHQDWKKWWYTAATRARNQLVVASYHYMHER